MDGSPRTTFARHPQRRPRLPGPRSHPTDYFVADGNPIGTFTIRAGFHITYDDVNGNGEADPGEITSEFEYLRIHCG